MEFYILADRELTSGDKLSFQYPHSWSMISGPSNTRQFQTTEPVKEHFISVTAINIPEVEFELMITERQLNYEKAQVRHGRRFTASLKNGVIPPQTPIRVAYENTFAPYVSETESVWVSLFEEEIEEKPVLETIPGPHTRTKVITPSFAAPGVQFNVRIISLDKFDNVSADSFPAGNLVAVDGSISVKVPPFTGMTVVSVSSPNSGILRFRFGDIISNAVKIDQSATGPYWGDIHIHTKLSWDAQGNAPYKYAQEVSCLDFAAIADHWQSLGPRGYDQLKQWNETANKPGIFITIPADERNPPELTGHHNIYCVNQESLDTNQAIFEKDQKPPQSSIVFLKGANPTKVMLIPHHTGILWDDLKNPQKHGIIWNAADDYGLRSVVEIFSHHGQSELYAPGHALSYEWNRLRRAERRANTSSPGPCYAQDYWIEGHRIGVIASSDEHSGQGGRDRGGIAALYTDNLDRKGIFQALRNRQCYATTGERILLEFEVNGLNMGEEGKCTAGEKINISFKVWGTDQLLRMEILKHTFGKEPAFFPLRSIFPKPPSMDAKITLEDIVKYSCVYYARVTQEPLEWPAMAWTSPIWLDVK